MVLSKSLAACLSVLIILHVNLTAAKQPIKDLHIHDQLSRLRSLGYNVDKLDNHTQLKVFLYTWLAMERGEGGRCKRAITNGCYRENVVACVGNFMNMIGHPSKALEICSSHPKVNCPRRLVNICTSSRFSPGCIGIPGEGNPCCNGWSVVMGICTKNSWYNGAESASLKSTVAVIKKKMKSDRPKATVWLQIPKKTKAVVSNYFWR